MKYLLAMAVAALACGSFASPASAFSTAHPSIQLVQLAPPQVGVTSAGPGCDVPASIDGNPFFEMPRIAVEQGVSGLAKVRIDITSTGRLASEELYGTSGNRWLDQAALLSARLTHYTAETANCERVAGTYLFEVEF